MLLAESRRSLRAFRSFVIMVPGGWAMPLNLYPDVYASGPVPVGWIPLKDGTIKYPVRNKAVLDHLRSLLTGRWQKVIKKGTPGEVHYFEHASGQVAGVKYYP
jgi:hypothetical protein